MRLPLQANSTEGAGILPSLFLDVRPTIQWRNGTRVAGSFHIPAPEVPVRTNELPPKDGNVVLYIIVSSLALERCIEAIRGDPRQGVSIAQIVSLLESHIVLYTSEQQPTEPLVEGADGTPASTSATAPVGTSSSSPVAPGPSRTIAGADVQLIHTDWELAEFKALRYLFSGKWPLEGIVTIKTVEAELTRRRIPCPTRTAAAGTTLSDEGDTPTVHPSVRSSIADLPVRLESGPSPWTDAFPPPRMWSPSPFLEREIQTIELELGGPGICLDVGCGSGRDMAFLAARGWTVVGLDNRVKLLDQARAFSTRYCQPIRAEEEEQSDCLTVSWAPSGTDAVAVELYKTLPLRPRSVDLLLCVRFLQRSLLPCLKDVIRSGGFVLYSHFVDGVQHSTVGHPKTVDGYLLKGELNACFASGPLSEADGDGAGASSPEEVNGPSSRKGMVVETLVDEGDVLEDGRPLVNFLARLTIRR